MSLYKALRAVIVNGDRVEKNKTVEVDDVRAAAIGAEYLVKVSGKKIAEVSDDNGGKLPEITAESSKAELIAAAEKRGLSKAGSRADLYERIKLFDDNGGKLPEDDDQDLSDDDNE